MDFAVPDELTALRQSFAAFLDREVRSIEDKVREEFWAATPDLVTIRSAIDEVKGRAAREGFYAAHLPESVGG
jgi:alkylation response protein AidB-like acyl-CoA dehydrogenase